MSVLSKDDRAFWDENGYVIIHDAVLPENVIAAKAAVWGFFGNAARQSGKLLPQPVPSAFIYILLQPHGNPI